MQQRIKSCALINSDDIKCYLGFGTVSKTEVFGDNAVLLIGQKLYFWNKTSESANEIIQTEENKDDIQELKKCFKKVKKGENGLYPLTTDNAALNLITKLTDTIPISEAFIKLAQARRIYRVLVYGENKHYPEDYKNQIESLSEEILKLAEATLGGFIHEIEKLLTTDPIEKRVVQLLLKNIAKGVINSILAKDPIDFSKELERLFTTAFNSCNLIKDEQLIKFKTNLFQSPLTQYSAGCEILSSTNQIEKICKEQLKRGSQISKLVAFYSAFNETTLANNTSIKNRQFSEEEIKEYTDLFNKIFKNNIDPLHTPILTAFADLNKLNPFYLFNESDIMRLFNGDFISYFEAINNDNETFKKTVDILTKATLALKPLEKLHQKIKDLKTTEESRNILKRFFLSKNKEAPDPEDIKKLMIFIDKLTAFFQVMPRIIMPLKELHQKVKQEENVHNELTVSPVGKNEPNILTKNSFSDKNPETSIFVPFNVEEMLQNKSNEEVSLSEVNDLSNSLEIVSKYCEKLNLFKACADYVYKINKLLNDPLNKNESKEYNFLNFLHKFLNNNSNYCHNKTDDLESIFNKVIDLLDMNNIVISEDKKEEYKDKNMVLIHEIYHNYKERCINNNIPIKEQKKKNISPEITPQVEIQNKPTISKKNESGDCSDPFIIEEIQDDSSTKIQKMDNQIPINQVPINPNEQEYPNLELDVPNVENEKTPYINRLNLYIDTIENLPKIGNTQEIDFKSGFHIAWNQRAKSRKTNYETAKKLRDALLGPNTSLKDVFKETKIYSLRNQTNLDPGMFGKKIHGRLKDIKDAVERNDPNYKPIK